MTETTLTATVDTSFPDNNGRIGTDVSAGDHGRNNYKDDEQQQQQQSQDQEAADAFDSTTSKGKDGGLFQQCMKSIRSSHVEANRLRMGIVVAGMFTDVSMYAEVIALFYLVTKAMEERCDELSSIKTDSSSNSDDPIATSLLSLGYHFTPDYEHDLQFLYETKLGMKSWKTYVNETILTENDAVRSYVHHIHNMTTGAEIAGATFCLWGALIIGGGAAAKPRAESLVQQKDSLHLFRSVTGPGRNTRKNDFVRVWDELVPDDDNNQTTSSSSSVSNVRDVIIRSCQDCMQRNNMLIVSVKKTPWWMKYMYGFSSAVVALLAVGLYQFDWD